jgi:predicted RNase H-like HicB family nuclease
MFSEYIGAALRRAKYESLENGSYMATVEGLRGVIATGETIENLNSHRVGNTEY